MDFANEQWVRVYKRDTVTLSMLTWQARALLWEMLRKCDRSGVLDVGDHGARGVSAITGIPSDVVGPALDEMLAAGVIHGGDGCYVFPRFLEAQETPASDASRQRDARDRRRRDAMGGVTKRDETSRNVTKRHAASRDVTHGHAASRDVTHGHAASRDVTLCHSETRQDKTTQDMDGQRDERAVSVEKPEAKNRKKQTGEAPEGYVATVALFTERFKSAYSSAPTWDGKSGKILKNLLARHGATVVQERIEVLFSTPPSWLRGVRDIGTLSSVFDKLATKRIDSENGEKFDWSASYLRSAYGGHT